MTRPSTSPAPLSRRFDAATVRDGAKAVRVDATEAERAALAAESGLPGIETLAADLLVARDGAWGLRVTGRVAARVRQTCVVTLEDFASDLDEDVDVRFAPEAEIEAEAAARAARPGGGEDEPEDLPDPIVGGRIDLGALVGEIMVLGLDPYPRKPGAAFAESAPAADDEMPSPFAVLRTLKDQDPS